MAANLSFQFTYSSMLLFRVLAEWRIMTNSGYAKNSGDGLLCSILWCKYSQTNLKSLLIWRDSSMVYNEGRQKVKLNIGMWYVVSCACKTTSFEMGRRCKTCLKSKPPDSNRYHIPKLLSRIKSYRLSTFLVRHRDNNYRKLYRDYMHI
jgi:hypothetical protein